MQNKNLSPLFLRRKVLASAITAIYFSVAMVPVYASDTEIYIQRDDSAPISPTLMMLFDTSGSMNWCVDDPANTTCSVVEKMRINVLKKAMQQVLRGDATVTPPVAAAPGYIKMGLAKYHPTTSRGGYVLYPARPLDAFVALNPDGLATATGASGSADAIQNSGFDLTGAQLAIGSNGSTSNVAGFQFSEVRIPKGATIRRAYIEVTAAQSQSGFAKWRITAENTDSAAEYSAASNIESRSYTAPTTVDVEPDAWTTGTRERIYVTDAIQGVVTRSGWCGDNNLAIRIADVPVSGVTPTRRTAYSYEGAPTVADRPALIVDYTVDPESTNSCVMMPRTTVIGISNSQDDVEWKTRNASSTTLANQGNQDLYVNQYSTATQQNIVGLRYRNVVIPYNARIDSAYLKPRAYGSVNGVSPLSVTSFDSINLADFCSTTNASSCAYSNTLNGWPVNTVVASEATWSPPSNNLVNEQIYAIPVTDAVRKVISKSGWASGNSLGFTLRHRNTANNSAIFYARNRSSSKAVQLEINWRERVTDLRNLETVRDQIATTVAALTVPSGTPLGAAFAEASRYLYGMQPRNRDLGAPTDYSALVVTDPAPNSATVRYKTPILAEDECSANYVFLLTDGEPANDSNVQENTQEVTSEVCTNSSNTIQKNWDCMKKLAEYNVRLNNRIGKPIRTNTVILGPLDSARTNMQAVATAGQGQFYEATNTAALVNAISRTIDDAASRSGTISAPGVAVNQINRISHLDQLYYAVFKPDLKYRWDGNLKRYRLAVATSSIVDNTSPTPLSAINPDTGLFNEGTKSFWSEQPDGAQATAGGAAAKLPNPESRKMFTYFGSLGAVNANLDPITFGTAFNLSAKTAMGLSASVADDIKFKNLINWYKGYAVSDLTTLADVSSGSVGTRNSIGAALHSQPVLVNYGYTVTGNAADAGNPDYQKNYIFFSTLGGTLHAIDAKTGIEKLAFIPGEKLNTLEAQFVNDAQVVPEFGMDGTWTYYREDSDLNGQINSGDKVYLYGGMRMGGSNYYALNLSNLNAPSLLFAINGGSTNYPRMGQTWSQPVIGAIKLGGRARTVIVFGGGYDPRHEVSGQLFTGDDLGNQLYIVDAFTGEKIWSASGTSSDGATTNVTDMTFSVVAKPKLIDMNGDGFIDNIYFGDLGGQVFRVDVTSTSSNSANLVKRVRLLAKLGQTANADVANQRRFYEAPDVALFKDPITAKIFATVVMGSGYRSRPLNAQTSDHFFTLFDRDVTRTDLLSLTPTQEARTEATGGLQTVITKANLSMLNTSSSAGVSTSTAKGWYMTFAGSGEKVLSSPLIYKERVSVVTYEPILGASNCSPVVGNSKLYGMCMPYGNICDASQTSRLRDNNVMAGISGDPQIMVLDQGNGTFKEVENAGTGIYSPLGAPPGGLVPTFKPAQRWREKTRNPAN